MIFKKDKSTIKEGYSSVYYNTDKPFNVEDIIKTINYYEKDNTKMFECFCETFSANGHPFMPSYRTKEALENMYNLPDPYIGVRVLFINTLNNAYKFSIAMDTTTTGMNYYYSKDDEDYVKRKVELQKMREEAEKKSQENSMNDYNDIFNYKK